jgi:hypothetical protein
LFKHSSACLVNICASTALNTLWFQCLKWNPSFITCYSYYMTEKSITIFVVSL